MMRALICLCAAALLFGAGCSPTNDAAQQESPGQPAEVSPTTPPPAEPGQMSDPDADTAMPPPSDMPPDQPPPGESMPPPEETPPQGQ